ncbi:hypothetical protein N7517_005962 [Penicillium concentricum]|uniref:Uncharacterized protein n=1 Tax=Penicillium concentricum TaxID=293559 RepID=A0A9W9S8C5_9EURO|nr:uncharacterized protein N7517_005962 [Penicillium concentricum]KAJ5373956.1 hypothetical protein N7517_005962 [Penicillium concentricum]
MSPQKQEKTPNLVKSLGLTPSQMDHLLMGYLCMHKPKIDWKKLADLSNVTPASARSLFSKARRTLEKWEEQRTAGVATKETEQAEDERDTEDVTEAMEDAHVEDTEN